MPPHDDMNQECVRLFTELGKLQAQQGQIIINHLEHDKEDRLALKETLEAFNERIQDLPTIKANTTIAKWVTGLVLGALIVGYITHLL
jgi:phage host-nuclease inhibitor protein Gam